jgi:hypothetical protein
MGIQSFRLGLMVKFTNFPDLQWTVDSSFAELA